jgi:two-component system NarL family response regulator
LIAMPGTRRIRVLCVDDHEVLRQGLTAVIGTQPDMEVVAEAADGQAAIDAFRDSRPDVTLMDLRLPRVSGSEAIAAIRRDWPQARILVLTTYDGIDDVHRALHAGARGYLLKDTLRRELVEAIRTVHRGGVWVSPSVAQRLAESLHLTALTPREHDILGCIVRGQSNKEIAVELGVAEGTVRIHVSHVLEKLSVSDRTQAAVAAIERGIFHLDRLPEP